MFGPDFENYVEADVIAVRGFSRSAGTLADCTVVFRLPKLLPPRLSRRPPPILRRPRRASSQRRALVSRTSSRSWSPLVGLSILVRGACADDSSQASLARILRSSPIPLSGSLTSLPSLAYVPFCLPIDQIKANLISCSPTSAPLEAASTGVAPSSLLLPTPTTTRLFAGR